MSSYLKSKLFRALYSTMKHIQRSICGQLSQNHDLRFIQFRKKYDEDIKLGVISENGETYKELSTEHKNSDIMINFIEQNYSRSEIINKIESIRKMEKSTKEIDILSPILKPEKIICIGLNYSGHCQEQNKAPPKEPMFFSKFASSLIGHNRNIIAHSISKKIDWEIELAVIIGKKGKNILANNAFDYIFGYSIAQDISARDWQKERNGGQFLIGKSMDTFCPLGPCVVHKSMITNPRNLNLTCKINGVVKQTGNTRELIFGINDIISYLSKCLTLQPGDIILTGTPAGVGMHRNPPTYLKPGDVIESEIQEIGKLINNVVSEV